LQNTQSACALSRLRRVVVLTRACPYSAALAQQLQAEEDAYERQLVEQQRHDERVRRQREQEAAAGAPPPRQERIEAQGQTSGAGAGSSKASKRLSKMAGAGGKGEKDKCVVM
jgi:hypothetical protein